VTLPLVTGAYLLGAVPFGVLVVRLLTGRDIRSEGSGNIGASNVLRTFGPLLGATVLILDLLKGAAPVMIAQAAGAAPLIIAVCGLAAVGGHNWSIFLRGKGGKGIATSYGVLLALSPLAGLMAVVVWVVVVAITRYASLASLLGVLSVPLVMLWRREPFEYAGFGVVALIFAVWRHRANIQRLLRGEELPILPRKA
jgi:glycerol-3-phosphate acyltransferase PlsY